MKLKNIASLLLVSSTLLLGGCMDKFSDLNSSPTIVKDADFRYQLTKIEENFVPSDYWAWYHDFSAMLKWGQITVTGGGNISTSLNRFQEASGGTNNIQNIIGLSRDIDYNINLLGDEGLKHKHIQAMAKSLVIFTILENTDFYGSRPYSELGLARFNPDPKYLTPAYDTQEKLFEDMLSQLDEIVDVLSSATYQGVTQTAMGKQDLFFGGQVAQWAKFANSLKLKIAARLYNVDPAKAIAIVNKAAKAPLGFMSDWEKDDLVNYKGSKFYGPNETPFPGVAEKQLIDFLKENRDPRLRFLFTKNEYNSKVVQAYFDAKAELPSYIKESVETEEVDGKIVFKGWKAPGEPWVRYHGVPSENGAGRDKQWEQYFDPSNTWTKIILNEKERSYDPMSSLQMQHYINKTKLTYPDAPDVAITEVTDPRVLYTLVMNVGEVNLYLAEFKLLGAELPQSAQAYFTEGITASVQRWNKMSELNKIKYYDTTYDANEAVVKLQDGEIAALLQKEAYKLSGDKKLDLEKVYLQQRFNFIFMPQEMFVTMRRSGIPSKDSTIYPLLPFEKGNKAYAIPRRASFKDPSPTSAMRFIYWDMLEAQGFSIGYDAGALNTERVWYDKNAPQFGEGIK